MRLLLTGAAGFLGRAAAAPLRAAGFDLVTTDRAGAVDVAGDLGDPSFAAALPDVDVVVHVAAVQYVSPDLPTLRREPWFRRNNVEATTNLARRYGGAATRFVNVGTSMMYRQGGAGALGRGSPMAPQGVYSASKLEAQRVVQASFERWATVVPCIIGGPGRGGLFTGFVRSIARARRAVFPGRGEHPVHMVHVDDAAALLALVAADARAAGFYNAAGPGPLSISRWVDEIAAELGVGAVRKLRVPLAPVEALARASGWRLLAREQVLMLRHPHVLDTADSMALGWKPRHDNARIVRDTAREIAARDRLT